MVWLIQITGIALIILALVDIYLSVLYARSGKGWVSVRLRKGMWRIFRMIAYSRFSKRDRFLPYCGPTLLITIVFVWILLLITGFALMFWPALGSDIVANQGKTPTDFSTALYYSGYIFTTLGTGDITPQTGFYRLLAILESGIGFSVFTLTITYVLAIYTALTQRNVFALSLHYRSSSAGNSAELLARIGTGGDFKTAHQDIADMSKNLLTLLESHHAYPVVHHFRFQETYYSLARIALLTMDTATLIRSAISKEVYRSLIYSGSVAELADGGKHLLHELSNSFLPQRSLGIKEQPEAVLRECYYRAVERLKLDGIETVRDIEAGADLYVSLRRTWEPYVMALAHYMGYDWSEIAPAEVRAAAATKTSRRHKFASRN